MARIDDQIKELQNKLNISNQAPVQEDTTIPITDIAKDTVSFVSEKASNPQNRKDVTNFIRTTLGQGTLLGFGDEIEAGLRSVFGGKGYQNELDQVRAEIDQFKKDRPVLAIGGELAGSLVTGAAGIGKTLVKTALKSGGLGAVYGAGAEDSGEDAFSKEDVTKRIENAVNSAIFSAGIGAAGQKFFGTSKQAKELLDKGVKLTPGQTIDGFVGSSLKTIEEALTSIPGLGTQSMFNNVKRTYNIAVANEILKPLNKTIPKNTNIKDVAKLLSLKSKKAMDDTADKLIINKPDELLDEIVAGIQNSKADKRIIEREIDNFNTFFMRQLSFNADDTMTGSSVQKLDEQIKKIVEKLSKNDQPENLLIADVFTKAGNKLDDILIKDSGEKAFNSYKTSKKVFRDVNIFNDAFEKSQTSFGFSPAQLKSSSKKFDPTSNKMGTVLGKGNLQNIANTGQDVLGMKLPDSGTVTRGIVGTSLLGGGYLAGVDPVAAGIGVGGLLAYKNPFIRNSLIGGSGIKMASPFLGSTLGERIGFK
jgi:hypothetical protein